MNLKYYMTGPTVRETNRIGREMLERTKIRALSRKIIRTTEVHIALQRAQEFKAGPIIGGQS